MLRNALLFACFACFGLPLINAATYSISGSVTNADGAPLSGVSITLGGGAVQSQTTGTDGTYSFVNLSEGLNYAVSPLKDSYTFSPPVYAITPLIGNLNDLDFIGYASTSSTYNISGRVTDTGGSPLPGVSITLGGGAFQSQTTGADGTYSFANLSEGLNYAVSPSKDGYTFSPRVYAITPLLSHQNNLDFVGNLSTSSTFSISGWVYEIDGRPLSGVSIVLGGASTQSLTTGSDGAFTFGGLTAGSNYAVSPVKSGWVFTPAAFAATPLTSNQYVEFTGEPTYNISGRVTDTAGNPLKNISITLGGAATQTTLSDSNGFYSFLSLTGLHSIAISAIQDGYYFAPEYYHLYLHSDRNDLDFVLTTSPTPTYRISGTVYDLDGAPVPGAAVTLGGGSTQSAITESDGSFSFSHLYGGLNYAVSTSKEGWTFSPPLYTFTPLISDRDSLEFSGYVSYHICGRVVDIDGTPLSGLSIALGGSTTLITNASADGAYCFENLRANSAYNVAPIKDAFAFTPPAYTVASLTKNLDNLEFMGYASSLSTYSISGFVVDIGGGAEPGVLVTLGGGASQSTTTGPDGSFRFLNLSGGLDYTVTPSKGLWTFRPPTITFAPLTSNQTNHYFTADDLYNISGKVLDVDGAPLSGVSIVLTGGSYSNTTSTDTDGTYLFIDVPNGDYLITASKDNYTFFPASHAITILLYDRSDVNFATSSSSIPIPQKERDALIALYKSTGGKSWTNKANWLGPAGTEGSWYGVGTYNGHVNFLALSHNNLVGYIPAELGSLSYLSILTLEGNELSGKIPEELANLSSLIDLSLRANKLTGLIPPQITNLAKSTFALCGSADCYNNFYTNNYDVYEFLQQRSPGGIDCIKYSQAQKPSILFLPGFMGSRLYKEGDELWMPDNDGDMLAMRPNEYGRGPSGIYTKPGDAIDSVWGFAIYKNFMSKLADLKRDNVICDFKIMAYDWRLDVEDISRNGVQYQDSIESIIYSIRGLAGNPPQHPITIVAHSNGGLLAKQIVNRLVETGQDNLVDRLIFVATPHFGTPEALLRLLHGENVTDGSFFADGWSARESAETMIGAYNLLPSPTYFENNDDIPLHFSDASKDLLNLPHDFDIYTDKYGDETSGMYGFLIGLGGREEPNAEDTQSPNKLRNALLEKVRDQHMEMDLWTAPPHIKVSRIIGTGIATTKALYYGTTGQQGANDELGYSISQTSDGDGTVVESSAKGPEPYTNQDFYVDLNEYNNKKLINRYHADILEIEPVQDLIEALVSGNKVGQIDFVRRFSSEDKGFIEIKLQSAVSIEAYDFDGHMTALIDPPTANSEFPMLVKEIPNSSLEMHSGHWQLTLDTQRLHHVIFRGTGLGSFGAVLTEYLNDSMVASTSYLDLPVMHGSVADLTFQHVTNTTQMRIDLDNDGSTDFAVSGNDTPVPENSLQILRIIIDQLELNSGIRQSLMATIDSVLRSIDRGNIGSAKNQLQAMVNKVEAQTDKHIPEPIAKSLLEIVLKIQAGL